jgi:lactosylceramide 4-alpha-galactosyltransferase
MRMARPAFPCYKDEMAPHVRVAKATYVHMAAALARVQQAKNSMVTPPSSPTMMAATRRPLSLLLSSISLPVLLLLLAIVFLVWHTTFSLFICPLLPKPTSRPNETSTSAHPDVSIEMTMQAFHNASTPQALLPTAPAAVKSSKTKKASTKRNKSLLKLLLRKTPQTRRFAARAAELFAAPCTDRFFMTWLSPLSQFGSRELLVLESLFRWHPGACLLVASDTMDSAGGNDRLSPFVERGLRVVATSPDLAYLLHGTPAEPWLGSVKRGGVSPGSVPLGQNLSNLLRLALLYKYGGVYLDADVVVLRPFSGIRNAVGAQSVDQTTGGWRRLNNAVMVFDQGHPVLREFIVEFAATFDGSKWGYNGPYLVSRVVRRRGAGHDVTVLPPCTFYPVDWIKIGRLFRAPKDRNGERWVKAKVENIKGESLAIHLWNRESRGLEVEDGSVIGRLVSDSCLFCNSSFM